MTFSGPIKAFSFPLIILTVSSLANASTPLVFRSANGQCTPSTEICGDGIDQDCDGSDLPCLGPDADLDGFNDSQDCDSTDRRIYPGIYVPCTSNGALGTKLCQAGGQYSACSTTPLCEATGAGKCYYISSSTGSDSNAGTFQKPWKTFLKVTNYYNVQDRPNGFVQLAPGDVVYFLSGVYKDTYFFENGPSGFQIRNLSATSTNPVKIKAFPGANVTFAPNQAVVNFKIYNSQNIIVEGLELTRGYGAGLRIEDGSSFIEGKNLWIHDTDGVDNFNIAGVYSVRSKEININHSFIHDNYDRTCEDTGGQKTENSRDLVFFDGGNIHINHNVIFQTPPVTAAKTGSCVVYKHGQDLPGGVFEVGNNILKNCYFTAIGTATYGGHFHHNLIIDSENSISIRNHGIVTGLSNNVAEFNTIINSIGLEFSPSQALEVGSTVGPNIFRKNIVIDNHAYNPDLGGIIKVDPYGSDVAFNLVTSGNLLQINNNCYFNPNTPALFGFFSSNFLSTLLSGDLYSWANWQNHGFDSGSFVTNPNLDIRQLPQNPSCLDKGRYAN